MKKTIARLPVLIIITASLLFSSCRKITDWIDESHNPLRGGCQVAEYHVPWYDHYYPDLPFLFKKIYDQSGKIVQEIDCGFWRVRRPDLQLKEIHYLLVQQKGKKIYLFNKNSINNKGLHDTAATITLNNEGRPDSCTISAELNDVRGNDYGEIEHFIYQNRRVAIIQNTSITPYSHGIPLTYNDSLNYDSQGNYLGLNDSISIKYDYSKTAKRQFCIDDLMGREGGFYLLQYLGYFPEVTSPVNVRSYVNAAVFDGDLTDHTFDAEGKLTSYLFVGNKVTIVWNCAK